LIRKVSNRSYIPSSR